MSVILHISDPHFGTEFPEVVAALTHLAQTSRFDAVILSGDVTQRARDWQFSACKRFLDGLACPNVMVLPGNHDIPLENFLARAFSPYGNYKAVFGDDLEPGLLLPDVKVVGLNTTRAYRHKDGEVSGAQARRAAEAFRDSPPEQLRVVVTHQPVHVILPQDETNRLHGSDSAVPIWADGGVDLILGGHIHVPYVRSLRERWPDLRRDIWIVNAGTATSSRVRGGAPNSINILRYDPSIRPLTCVVERWNFDAPSAEFALGEPYKILLDR